MDKEQTQLDELSREIRKVIDDNRKFLAKIMDEEFEPEEDESEEAPEVEF